MLTEKPKGPFTRENPGTFCIDLFIAESDFLNKGFGTEIIKQFTKKLIHELNAKKILIDPAAKNKRAIRCYEKAGFFEHIADVNKIQTVQTIWLTIKTTCLY